jgi:3-deoxy-D-arabino-heptulosonate 7-phosphate (DAHP) synthase class II
MRAVVFQNTPADLWCGFTLGFVNYKKGCTRLAATSYKVYQLLAHGLWFSPGTPASSTTKTGRHDIAEILLKVAVCPFSTYDF